MQKIIDKMVKALAAEAEDQRRGTENIIKDEVETGDELGYLVGVPEKEWYDNIRWDDSSTGKEIINFLQGYVEGLEKAIDIIQKGVWINGKRVR